MTHAASVHFTKTHAVVLCPSGHLVTAVRLDKDFAGSMNEAELGAYQAGLDNVFDRLASSCDIADDAKRGQP